MALCPGSTRQTWLGPTHSVADQASSGSGAQAQTCHCAARGGDCPALRDTAIAILVRPARVFESGQQPAVDVLRGAVGADFPAFCGVNLRAGAQPAEAVRRTATGRAGLEVSDAAGGDGSAAFVLAGDRDVLVRVRTDEPDH